MTAMELPGYGPATYGDSMADVYDSWFADALDTTGALGFLGPLAELVGGPGARLLELGVGTGRLAVPLAAQGFDVTGVDASEAMLAALAAKPGGDLVTAVHGDMAAVDDIDGAPFDVVYVAWNSLFNLTSSAEQSRCLAGVAARLAGPSARFVVEAFVPDDSGGERRDSVEVRSMTAASVVLSVSRHEPESQEVGGHYVQFTEADGIRMRPWFLHYLTPVQLDELAAGAGLVLLDRWADWVGTTFDDTSPGHVSVYGTSPPG